MAYQNVSFSAGENLTATKMNQMAANDAAFHDGPGIAAGAITADKIDFTTFEYSTDEQIVGKWIDGKTIYKKTIECGTIPNNTTKQVPTGISDLSEIVKWEGVSHNASGTSYAPFPQNYTNNGSMYSGATVTGRYTKTTNTIDIFQNSGFESQTVIVTLYYTKTS